MTYYLERDTRDGYQDVVTIAENSREDAIVHAARIHDMRMPATAAVLWDHAHRAVCTFGPSGELGETETKCKKFTNMLNNHYYGDLFDN